ncbi:MAG TPA: radical SAM protein [Dehalococcoidia bacterium]|nr:radical SAM protein [Dehalococcoidia bacterium]
MTEPSYGQAFTYELPPIRPPSEARSLLIRVMRGCPWNYCTFCAVYKDLPRKGMLRSVDEVKGDIDALRAAADEMRSLGRAVEPRTAFLADSNAIIVKTDDLVEIILYLRESFPSIERITSYARAKTVLKKDLADLRKLHGAGLSRLHMGLESGDDEVLTRVKKGATSREMIDAGRKAMAAGFELSEYVMPGLGGWEMTEQHARNTAAVLNATNPSYVRVRPLTVTPGTPLYDEYSRDAFFPMNPVEMLDELRRMVEALEISGNICFDHFMNAPIFRQDWEGYRLPDEKEHLLSLMDESLASFGRGRWGKSQEEVGRNPDILDPGGCGQ